MKRPHIRSLRAASAAAGTLALAASLALAQQGPPNALQGFSQNRNVPVKIQAAKLEVRDKDKIATFSGKVHLVQGDTEMRCNSLVVHYENQPTNNPQKTPTVTTAQPGPGGAQQVRLIIAKGNVHVTQKDQYATGETGIFDVRANTVTLEGNVVVTRGKDVLRGHRLVVNLTTGVSRMEAPGQGRVEGLFMPNQPGAPGPGPTPLGPRPR
jgi:lipopolysaccharide export system protein LptA